MKKEVGIIAIIAVHLSSSALANDYVSPGTYSISGSAMYNEYNPEEGPKNKTLGIGPKYLYFMTDNVSIGGALNYYQNWYDGQKYESYGIGPLIRYYYHSQNILPFLSLEYLYTKAKASGSNVFANTDTEKRLSIGAGLNYFITNDVALETELKYSFISRSGYGNDSNPTNINLNIGINVFFK